MLYKFTPAPTAPAPMTALTFNTTERVDEKPRLVEITVQLVDIAKFGVYNMRCYTKKGKFSKFHKIGFIRLANGEYYKCGYHHIQTLKQQFKGRTSSEKQTEIQYKSTRLGFVEKKATDWSYTVKK